MPRLDTHDFNLILSHAVTCYDRRRLNRPDHNPNALGLYLGAVERICLDIANGIAPRDAIVSHTNDRLQAALLKALQKVGA